jgi:hypothetical protein
MKQVQTLIPEAEILGILAKCKYFPDFRSKLSQPTELLRSKQGRRKKFKTCRAFYITTWRSRHIQHPNRILISQSFLAEGEIDQLIILQKSSATILAKMHSQKPFKIKQ